MADGALGHCLEPPLPSYVDVSSEPGVEVIRNTMSWSGLDDYDLSQTRQPELSKHRADSVRIGSGTERKQEHVASEQYSH